MGTKGVRRCEAGPGRARGGGHIRLITLINETDTSTRRWVKRNRSPPCGLCAGFFVGYPTHYRGGAVLLVLGGGFCCRALLVYVLAFPPLSPATLHDPPRPSTPPWSEGQGGSCGVAAHVFGFYPFLRTPKRPYPTPPGGQNVLAHTVKAVSPRWPIVQHWRGCESMSSNEAAARSSWMGGLERRMCSTVAEEVMSGKASS